MRIALLLIVASVLTTSARAEEAAELTVDEIVARTNRTAYYQGADGRAHVSMVIIDKQGRERTRRFTILRRDAPAPEGEADDSYTGDQKFYVYFHEPADVRKMVFMVWKHLGADDDRWLYLPALDLVKRIAATEERTSFVGSDFFYEDVSGRGTDEDVHELVETTGNYYVLKNTPVDPKSVEFAWYQMWIHRTKFIPVSTKYYDADGNVYREYSALAVKDIDGRPTVTKSQMTDHRQESQTVMEYGEVKYDIGLPDDIFTERFLRRPPREFLK